MTPEQMSALAAPFPPEQIKQVDKGFGPVDYVDHAHVTERLNQVIPGWTWEPMGRTDTGLPAFDDIGGLWIWLELPDGTKVPGYGEPGGKGHDAIKGAISDAIKIAAMRLGVALDLWKGAPVERVQVFQDVKHEVGPARGPQARDRASTPASEKQRGYAKKLLGNTDRGIEIVTEYLGEFRPVEVWSKYEASQLIDRLQAAKDEQHAPERSSVRQDDEWTLQEPPEDRP
jgi:hypothetical protein